MPTPVALLVLLIIEIILLPVAVLGSLLLAGHFILDVLSLTIRGERISMTAYDPLFALWTLGAQGKREDRAARQLPYALPGVSPLSVWPMMGPSLWALRVTGIAIHIHDYPVYNSSNLVDALGHRTRFFDDALLYYLYKVNQVVIPGAGWDTRAYGLARREGVQVFGFAAFKLAVHRLLRRVSGGWYGRKVVSLRHVAMALKGV